MSIVYISGPMTGYPDNNFPAFEAAMLEIKRRGDTAVSPHEGETPGLSWEEYLRDDIKILVDCSGIYMLRGWEKSRGATLELFIATQLGFSVEFQGGLVNRTSC